MKRSRKKMGTVYLVGAGPGDPGLLTLRAKECLEAADAVFYDHLVNPEILRHCRGAALCDVGKRSYRGHVPQARIERQLVQAARRFRRVVRLKGGDPFIFGRGGEEAQALRRAGVPFEVVPGVTSAVAAPAYAGIPLTHRRFGSSVTFLTGHEEPGKGRSRSEGPALDWEALAREPTLVFLMGVKTLRENFRRLLAHGKKPSTPAALIEWGTYPRQRVVVGDLRSLPRLAERAAIQAPAIAVVGELVGLRRDLAWFEQRPLFGRKILVTRAPGQASALSRSLREAGAQALELSALSFGPPKSWRAFDRACACAESYDWLVFSSRNAVEACLTRLEDRRLGPAVFRHARVAAVGPMTADRLREAGLRVHRQPKEFNAMALAATFSPRELQGKRVLFPRAERGREEAIALLQGKGAKVDRVTVYRSLAPKVSRRELRQLFAGGLPDLLTFTSGAAAEHLAAMLRGTPYAAALRKVPALVIGPVTRSAARRAGWKVVAVAKQATIESMADAVEDYFSKRKY
ncbi:MAG: uroporphyrinogen-III C-methyltransferase [bacterium]